MGWQDYLTTPEILKKLENFREPVESYNDLPLVGNKTGDLILVKSELRLYAWNGDSWEPVSGGTGESYWTKRDGTLSPRESGTMLCVVTSSVPIQGVAYIDGGVLGCASSCGVIGCSGIYGVFGCANCLGVFGRSDSYYGVMGFAGNSYGVYGCANLCYGVYGISGSCYGVYGRAVYYGVYGCAYYDYGVYGYVYYGNYAVYGEVTSPDRVGLGTNGILEVTSTYRSYVYGDLRICRGVNVLSELPASPDAGYVLVDSQDNVLKWYDGTQWRSAGGTGESYWSKSDDVLYPSQGERICVVTTDSRSIVGCAYSYGVYGCADFYGVVGCAISCGVFGSADEDYGVYGYAYCGYGVYGHALCYGVYGRALDNYAVYGRACYSYGVYGSAICYGVYGTAYSYGVYGTAYFYGVLGYAGFDGVYGYANYYGVHGYASGNYAVYGDVTSPDKVGLGTNGILEVTSMCRSYICGMLGIGTSDVFGRLHVNGSIATKVTVITSDSELDIDESVVLADAGTSSIVISLPQASLSTGRQYTIKKIDNSQNTVTISAYAGDTIEGNEVYVLSSQYQYVVLVAGTDKWYIISS